MSTPFGHTGLGSPETDLDALLDVTGALGSGLFESRVRGLPNVEAREILLDAVRTARVQQARLAGVAGAWSRRSRGGVSHVRTPLATFSPPRDARELVEGCLEVAEDAETLYRSLAVAAPGADLARPLKEMAEETRVLAFRLRALL